MSLKNGNTVALERRMDLASLFCMIGRHGPAVALAVVAMVSVLAALLIYRTVRVKRRKATAVAPDSASERPEEEERRGASASRTEHEPGPEGSFASANSTDVCDEGSSHVKEDADLTQGPPKIRLRRVATSEKKRQVPSRNPCGTEVFKADCQGDKEDDSLVHFDPYVSENIDERPQDNEHTPEANSVELGLEETVMCSSSNRLEDEATAPVHGGGEDGSEATDVMEETLHEGCSNKFAAVKSDTCSSQLDKQEVNIKQADGLTYSQEDGVLPIGADQAREEEMLSDNVAACGKECGGSSWLPGSSVLCFSEPGEVNSHSRISSAAATNSKAQISGVACREKEATSSDKDAALNIVQCNSPSLEEEIQPEESTDPQHRHLHNQQDGQIMNNVDFDKASSTSAPATYVFGRKPDENVIAYVTTEDSCFNLPSFWQGQQSGHRETNGAFNKPGVDSAAGATPHDTATITGLTASEGESQTDILPSFRDQQRGFSEVMSALAPGLTSVINPPFSKMNLLPLEQSELKDNDKDKASSPGVGGESGISSMTVSPDLQDADTEFVNAMLRPAMDFDSEAEKRTEVQKSLFADDATEDTAEVEFKSCQSDLLQEALGEPSDFAKYESFAANEDIFGYEVEENYHNAVDQFMAQIAASITSFTGELKKKTQNKDAVEGIEIREGRGGSVKKTMEMKAEKETEEDCEKTEISIMEATMDNNEWITDSNYHVLPWMNVSVPSFAQDNKNDDQLSCEERHGSVPPRDAASKDTDTTPCTEVKSTRTLSLTDENAENGKKVVAVQPMPQNVSVTFRIHYLTHSPYQTVAVTGNQQELGNWKGFVPLERGKGGLWATVVSLPAESHVEWKFVVLDKGEVCRWEECGNRLLDTGFGDNLIVHKWWGLL